MKKYHFLFKNVQNERKIYKFIFWFFFQQKINLKFFTILAPSFDFCLTSIFGQKFTLKLLIFQFSDFCNKKLVFATVCNFDRNDDIILTANIDFFFADGSVVFWSFFTFGNHWIFSGFKVEPWSKNGVIIALIVSKIPKPYTFYQLRL